MYIIVILMIASVLKQDPNIKKGSNERLFKLCVRVKVNKRSFEFFRVWILK